MDRHEKLFKKYLTELTTARDKALTWWDDLLTDETRERGSSDAAQLELERRWPFGPASHPFVIAVYRKFYLGCVELNRLIEEEENQRNETVDVPSDESWGESDGESGEDEDEDEDEEGEVEPMVFVFEWLSGPHKPLREFLARLVFVPIADGENG